MSTKDEIFLRRVREWLSAGNQIVIVIRYHAAGGMKHFIPFSYYNDFLNGLAPLAPRTSVTVVRFNGSYERGSPSDQIYRSKIESAARDTFSNGGFVIITDITNASTSDWPPTEICCNEIEFRKEVDYFQKSTVLVGPMPPWHCEGPDVIDAIVPDSSGSIKIGIY